MGAKCKRCVMRVPSLHKYYKCIVLDVKDVHNAHNNSLSAEALQTVRQRPEHLGAK